MSDLNNSCLISLTEIDDNDEYRISKKSNIEPLTASIRITGVVRPVVLIKNNDRYKIILGHNRVEASRILQRKDIPSYVWDTFDAKKYFNEIIEKLFSRQVGTVGKMRIYYFLNKFISVIGITNKHELKNILMIPQYITGKEIEAISSVDPSIIDYLNSKDSDYKTIIRIAEAEKDIMSVFKKIVDTQTSMSIVRQIVEMYDDIKRNADWRNEFKSIVEKSADKNYGLFLLTEMKNIILPELTALENNAEFIKSEYAAHGVKITIPQNFEGDEIGVLLTARRRDRGKSFSSSLQYLSEKGILPIINLY